MDQLEKAKTLIKDAAEKLNLDLSEFKQSAAKEWQYCTVNGMELSIGASTGGIVSFNGDPFNRVNMHLNDNYIDIHECFVNAINAEKKS